MHIGYSFFFLGHWQAVIALPLAGTERDATPSWLTKPPCFDRGLSEEGNERFSSALVEGGLSCAVVLPSARGKEELVGCVIMSDIPPVAPQTQAAPLIPREAPGPAAGSSSAPPLSLGSRAVSHLPQYGVPKPG